MADDHPQTGHAHAPSPPARVWAANRFALDYHAEAARLGPPVTPIIDIHTHINGPAAAAIYDRARRAFGITQTYSMTYPRDAQPLRDALGDSIQFIAIPTFTDPDRHRAMRQGFLENIETFATRFGSRIVKFWVSPRSRDLAGEDADVLGLESEWKIRAADLAASLNMIFMVHVADPDTWFATKYKDATRYGSKLDQYAPLERMLTRYPRPWIAAHMGGWPEDLNFLDTLLTRHPNLHLDASATKWMVRELSKHPREQLLSFLTRWRGRILFGSDIVTTDEHLRPAKSGTSPTAELASTPDEAFDLYASRYFALRALYETTYVGESPIADPDLAMIDPQRFNPMSAPQLVGKSLPPEELEWLYRRAAENLLNTTI